MNQDKLTGILVSRDKALLFFEMIEIQVCKCLWRNARNVNDNILSRYLDFYAYNVWLVEVPLSHNTYY